MEIVDLKINIPIEEQLIGKLDDKYWGVRRGAVIDLGDLGCTDDKVISALIKMLKDENQYVRGSAAGALGKLGYGGDRVIAALRERLNDYEYVRQMAFQALHKLHKLGC